MRAPLSIVIPTLNAAQDLPGTLASLVPGLQSGLIREVIVSDGGSTDGTTAIAESAGAILVEGQAGRGAQLARGVERAGGTWILLLHADTHLSANWPDAVQSHMESAPEQAGYFSLLFREARWPARQVSAWANLRSRIFGLPFGDQGLLISRRLLSDIGGVPPLPLMEDVALASALKGRLRRLDAEARTSAGRYEREGWFRRGARNLTLQIRFFLGANPDELARTYRDLSEN